MHIPFESGGFIATSLLGTMSAPEPLRSGQDSAVLHRYEDAMELKYSEYLPIPTQGEVNMIGEESVEEWVEEQISQLQLQERTLANTQCVLCKVLLSSLIEDMAMQDELCRRWSEHTQCSMARHWIWINTEGMSDKSFFAHIVRVAWLFHPQVFSRTHRE